MAFWQPYQISFNNIDKEYDKILTFYIASLYLIINFPCFQVYFVCVVPYFVNFFDLLLN